MPTATATISGVVAPGNGTACAQDKKDVARILKCFDSIEENPRGPGSEKLSGQDRYRVRQGIYRIIYETQDDVLVVTVVRVGHQREVYKGS